MKKISTIQLAISFIGVFLGAGFVSGQELWQFFACFGPAGFLGFLISAALFFLVDYALLQLARRTGSGDVAALVLPGQHPRLCALIDVMQCLLLFGTVVIMIAGGAALLQDMTGLPAALCGALFTLALLPVAMFELRGLVAAFSVLVPVLAILAVVMGVTVLFRQEFRFIPTAGSVSTLLPNWWISGITYAAYNLFCTIGVLAPFAKLVKDGTTIRRGLGLGSILFVMMTFSILAAMMAVSGSADSQLPAAMLARQLHPALGFVYDLLMGLAMFAAALAGLVALTDQGGFHWPFLRRRRKSAMAVILLLSYVLSLLGFSDLIGIVYPVFGYLSIPLLILLVRNWIKSRRI